MNKWRGKVLAAITMIAVITAIVMVYVSTSSNRAKGLKTSLGKSPGDYEAESGQAIWINEGAGDGVANGEIVIGGTNSDWAYDMGSHRNGYCLLHWSSLRGTIVDSSFVYSSSHSAYETASGQLKWLYDNIATLDLTGYRTDHDVSSCNLVTADEYQFYVDNLSKLYSGVTEMSPKQIFLAQQYAIWHYTNNEDCTSGDASVIELYNALVTAADNHSTYSNDGQESITITDSSNHKLNKQSDGSILVGPYEIGNSAGKVYRMNVSGIKINGSDVSYKILKNDQSTEISNGTVTDYNGNIYLKITGYTINSGTTYTLSGTIGVKSYKTIARYWTCDGGYTNRQPVATLYRVGHNPDITASATYQEETTQRTVRKFWNDNHDEYGVRPPEIKVQLLADGVNYGGEITLNQGNNWQHTWGNLPIRNNGTNITYSVREVTVPGYTVNVRQDTSDSTLIIIENTPTTTEETGKGEIGLYKYEDTNGNGKYDEGEPSIEGAEFKIATSEENAENGVFVKDERGNDLVATSGRDGTAKFENLAFSEADLERGKKEPYVDDDGVIHQDYDWSVIETTYYIKETKTPQGYREIEDVIEAKAKKGYYDVHDVTTLVQVGNTKKIYDLALRKFITEVEDGFTGKKSKIILNLDDKEEISRVPKIDLKDLKSGKSTTATYDHIKTPVLVHTTDIVTYTIQVYNEGPEDAYAAGIKDDIPEGLEFVPYKEGDGSVNDTYRWKMVDENDNPVTDAKKAKYIVTDYLAMDANGDNLIKGFDKDTMTELDSRFVKVQFKVTEPTTSKRIVTNSAQISKETDANGKDVTDRDSTANVWKGEDDEDVEHVRVLYFDLALRKWVTQAIVTDNGVTKVIETGHHAEDNPEEVVKVDLKKSKLKDITVKFKYSIRITNEGEIPGEATEIMDDIPEGLEFDPADNPDWKLENGKIVTNKLAGTTLAPGESAEVEIILTWIKSEDNMGVKVNVAEINKDHNNYGTKDIDSTPGNNVPGEDDIDDAPVMLSIATGSELIKYVGLGFAIIAIVMLGTIVTKKVLKKEDSF